MGDPCLRQAGFARSGWQLALRQRRASCDEAVTILRRIPTENIGDRLGMTPERQRAAELRKAKLCATEACWAGLLLTALVVRGRDFGAQQVYPAAVTEGVDGFAVHERMHGLAAADGVLLGVVKKDSGAGVNGDGAGICERVACDLAGVDGVALLVDRFGFAGGAVKAQEDGIIGQGGGKAIGLLVLPGVPEFPFGGEEIGGEFRVRAAGL